MDNLCLNLYYLGRRMFFFLFNFACVFLAVLTLCCNTSASQWGRFTCFRARALGFEAQ